MMAKRRTPSGGGTHPNRVSIVTLDNHLVGTLGRAAAALAKEGFDLDVRVHVAGDWGDPNERERLAADVASSRLVVVGQIFLQEHVDVVKPLLEAAPDDQTCGVLLSNGELTPFMRMGSFSPGDPSQQGRFSPARLLAKLRGKSSGGADSAKKQLKSLRRARKILRFVPGSAQDVRAYLLSLEAWLSGSTSNITEMLRLLAARYLPEAAPASASKTIPDLETYPETGLYHPDLPGYGIVEEVRALPRPKRAEGTVGLLVGRSYVLAGNTAHYDAVIRALEARGIAVRAAFAAGLDAREPIERFFTADGRLPQIDYMISLTGFSLVGGPAWHDGPAAQKVLAELDVPFVVAQPLEFQTLDGWKTDPRGLLPLEAALMVAIPELDGATNPIVFGGRADTANSGTPDAVPIPERIERLAERAVRSIRLRRKRNAERKVAVVLFNFPPAAGNAGSAAYLDVFDSLHRLLVRMAEEGYDVEVPDSTDALRAHLVGEAARAFGTRARIHLRIPADEHVASEPYLDEIEAAWGPAPGRDLSDGANVLILGAQFGNVFVGLQPGSGYEGDPMRLLFERNFAPTHAFSAFYRWIRHDFDADAMVHFGTHGATEFLPGKQVGMSGECWPDRMFGDTPNVYIYAGNNPSEGTLAKRRGGATLVSYMTPSLARAGLYKDLLTLKSELDRWSGLGVQSPDMGSETLLEAIRERAGLLELPTAPEGSTAEAEVAFLREKLLELEYSLVPTGLHVLGSVATPAGRREILRGAAEAGFPAVGLPPLEHWGSEAEVRSALDDLFARLPEGASFGSADGAATPLVELGLSRDEVERLFVCLDDLERKLGENPELDAVLHALDTGWIAPAPGGDIIRNTDVLPSGRNTYGFDPWTVPSAAAQVEATNQANLLLERIREEKGDWPETIALALWGTDNMKREGAPLSQALAMIGAEPAFDAYGRLGGARLIPLEELGRPRVDVIVTTSGVFRDLLPLQMKLLAEAAWLAASAEDEPLEQNAIRRHALAQAEKLGCSLEQAALRVFSNDDGAYGANVNLTVEGSTWDEGDELAEVFVRRKGFAYGRDGRASASHELLELALTEVDATYQNLDSVELGVSDIDQYVDSLGGITKAAQRASGREVAAFIGDETRGSGRVRTLDEQVALETRTRTLNPKWYEAMLEHGYQGVREIEARLTTTLGWSATTDSVAGWIYDGIGETYVLDPEMRRRLAELNPDAASRMAGRLLEACDRGFWAPDEDTLAALQDAADELEDRLEGINPEVAA
jgi:magnesium chelatase subunit H